MILHFEQKFREELKNCCGLSGQYNNGFAMLMLNGCLKLQPFWALSKGFLFFLQNYVCYIILLYFQFKIQKSSLNKFIIITVFPYKKGLLCAE